MGVQAAVRANVGEAESSGFDMSVDYNYSFNKNFWMQGRFNFTYATSKITKYEEVDYSNTPWRSKVGHSINQQWGYVAERLFVDEQDIANSPKQFGDYLAGDIKYKDINNDGVITEADQVLSVSLPIRKLYMDSVYLQATKVLIFLVSSKD